MDTEQSTAESVDAATAAMERKLFGGPEPDEASPGAAAAEVPAPEGDDETDTEQEPAPVEDLYEFEADDGEVIKVPAKLKDYVERSADYTRKTQEVARLRQQAEDKAQYNDAREQFINAAFADASELQAMQIELKRYQSTDWDALYNASPGQALKLQQQMREIERGVAEKQHALAQKGQQITAAQARHTETQWQLAEQGALQRIGHLTPADNQAMADQVRRLGFDAKEFRAKAADPRLLHAVYKAAKWDALQASKGATLSKLATAPPVVKPGSSDPAMTAKMQGLNWSKQMKNAKTTTEKRALAEERMTKFFGS